MYLKINLLEDEELRKTIKGLVESQLKSLVREEVTKTINSEVNRILKTENGFISSLLDTKIKEYLAKCEYSYTRKTHLPRLESIVRDILGEKIKLAMEDRLMKSFLDLCKEEE
jgi:hypothetical protein